MKWLMILSTLLSGLVVASPYSSLEIFLDADQTHLSASGQAIALGIETALEEVNYSIQGMDIKLVKKDHRGSSARSKSHLNSFLKSDSGVAVFSGLHSPPLLAHKQFINQNAILVLDPWAAAGPITRSSSEENWIFRLSVDDSKAGEFITAYALEKEGFKAPYLILEETGWGKSNLNTMTKAIESRELQRSGLSWFQWQLSESAARIMVRSAINSGADVIFLVANAPEGLAIANAMLSFPEDKRLPIRSHWGITGSSFPFDLGIENLEKLDLKFIQTEFNFLDTPSDHSKLLAKHLIASKKLTEIEELTAVTGFAHAYDLTKILINACNSVAFTGEITKDRELVKTQLENLNHPTHGLLKTYRKPFSSDWKTNRDAHEALGIADMTMGYYDKQGIIRLSK